MAYQLIPQELLQQAAHRFRFLGEPMRLEILNLLQLQGELSVQELVEATGQQQGNVSKHLKLLTESGLTQRRREGLFAYYSISDPSLAGLCLLVSGQLQRKENS